MNSMVKSRTKFSQWLTSQYLDWQHKQGRITNLSEFAAYIAISQSQLSQYMNDRYRPSIEVVAKIAEVLGNEIYDALDLPQPDPLLTYIQSAWDRLTPAHRQALHEQTEQYLNDHEPPPRLSQKTQPDP